MSSATLTPPEQPDAVVGKVMADQQAIRDAARRLNLPTPMPAHFACKGVLVCRVGVSFHFPSKKRGL